MNGNRMIRMAIVVCVAILVIAVSVQAAGLLDGSLFGYAHAEKYTAGDADIGESVCALDIHWENGKVNLEYHSGEKIELRESSSRPISEDMKMRWWLDGDTLRVQYAKSGLHFGWNQEKELTVRIPEGSSFREVNISATSGDLNIPELKADTLNLEVTSGNIRASADAKKVSVSATSGDIAMQTAAGIEAMTVGTTSGNILVEAKDIRTLKGSSTSGDILLHADQVKTCEAGSTSGTVTIHLSEADLVNIGSTSGAVSVKLEKFSSLKANTTSGGITAELPEHPGFAAQIDTLSGKINYTLALAREGDRYICGDGGADVRLGTTSGDIQLNRAEQ